MRSGFASLLGLVMTAACSSGGNAVDSGTDGTSQDSGDGGSGLLVVPLTACTQLAYTAPVSIGTQTFPLFLDTGSTTLGVAGAGCTTCNVTPLYMPGSTATDTNMTASQQFEIGSWSGEIYQDSVGLASGPSVPMRFVSITSQKGFFRSSISCGASGTFDGVIGFARAPEALPDTDPFFDQLVTATGIPNVFATELCDNGGTLWLGGFDPAATTAPPQYTPVTTDIVGDYYDSVDLETLSVGGTSVTVTIPGGGYADTVLDTGTSAIVLQPSAVLALAGAIAGTPGFQQVFGGDGGTSFLTNGLACANIPQTKAEIDAVLPPLTLTFGTGAAAITVQALATESYLYPYAGLGWCAAFDAFEPSTDAPFAAILGSPILRSNVIVFDRDSSQVGFAPHAPCSGE
jgi:hypothetical protein